MSAKKYFGAFCLYLNYLVHGIGVLVMSLNVHEFEVQWQTDAAGVSVVISSLGLGRLALLVLAGSLSDKYGRRPFVLLGTVTYLAFFIGLLFTHDVGTAYFFGLLAGAANSLLDAGTYPRLMELFPKAPGPAVILVKAFVAAGQFSLPLILSFLVAHELWFGWSLLIAAAILALNFCVLFWMPIKVPDQPTRLGEPLAAELAQLNDPEAKLKLKRSSRIAMPELISYTLFGYTAMATFLHCESVARAVRGIRCRDALFRGAQTALDIHHRITCRGVLLIARTADIFVSADDAARLHHCLNASARRRLLFPVADRDVRLLIYFRLCCRRRRCSAWPRHDGCSVSSGQRPGHRHLLQCGEHLQFHHAAHHGLDRPRMVYP